MTLGALRSCLFHIFHESAETEIRYIEALKHLFVSFLSSSVSASAHNILSKVLTWIAT
jgi:hypothetical protein